MSELMLSGELHRQIRDAMRAPFRFERSERFAMSEVLRAAGRQAPVDSIYLDTARDALARRGRPGHLSFAQARSRLGAAA